MPFYDMFATVKMHTPNASLVGGWLQKLKIALFLSIVAIRRHSMRNSSLTSQGTLQYTISLQGRRVHLKATKWASLPHLHIMVEAINEKDLGYDPRLPNPGYLEF
jgi:hypothetical protein